MFVRLLPDGKTVDGTADDTGTPSDDERARSAAVTCGLTLLILGHVPIALFLMDKIGKLFVSSEVLWLVSLSEQFFVAYTIALGIVFAYTAVVDGVNVALDQNLTLLTPATIIWDAVVIAGFTLHTF